MPRYLLGSYRIATAPEPSSSRLTSFKSMRFDSPANNVGPWFARTGCTTSSYSSINPSSASASGSFTHVEYALIGGYALALQGIVRLTEDVDILVEPTLENARRWVTALSTW